MTPRRVLTEEASIELFVSPQDDAGINEALAVMHRAFAEYSRLGEPSGALLETAASLQQEMRDGVGLAVARVSGHIRAMLKHRRSEDGTSYFSRLSVDPEYRGCGLSASLIHALRENAHSTGLIGLSCLVRADTADNIRLYEHLGMETIRAEQRTSLTGATLSVVFMRDTQKIPSDISV